MRTTPWLPTFALRLTGALAFVALACGGGEETPQVDETPAAGASDQVENRDVGSTSGARRSGPPGPIVVDSFRAVVSGARDTTYQGSTANGDVEAATNCILEKPARISFTTSPGDEPSASRFRAITGSVIDPGQTGTFPADTVTYWYPRMGLPSQTTYTGTGALEITRHDAHPDSRRMTGRITGDDLADSRGGQVDVEVEFDLAWSCGMVE